MVHFFIALPWVIIILLFLLYFVSMHDMDHYSMGKSVIKSQGDVRVFHSALRVVILH